MNQAHIEQVLAIVRQLRDSSWYWLSNSGKGVKEVCGRLWSVRKSVRGLTINVMDSAGKIRPVSWRVSQAVADRVIVLFGIQGMMFG